MRAMQIINWGAPLELRTCETPVPKGEEILLRVDACGVCHSDLHIWDGFFDLGNDQKFAIEERGVQLPFTLGHEPVGTVVAKGADVSSFVEIGESYAVYPWINCGECQPCQNRLTQICDAPKIIGTRVDGAYADHVLVPRAEFLVDYKGIEPELACILGCAGLTSYSALKKVELDSLDGRDSLLIIGSGGVGLAAISIARALCDARIIVADIDPSKRDAALQAGAAKVVDANAESALGKIDVLAQSQEGMGVAASIDFVGLPQTMSLGLNALRKGGQHIHVGLFGGAHSLSLPPVAFRMLRISGSYVGTLIEFRELIALVRDGMEMAIPISTRPLEEASGALEDLRQGKIVGRVVLKP